MFLNMFFKAFKKAVPHWNSFKFSWRSKTAPTISRIIQQFKGSITRQVGFPIWQKLFYDHIIRNQKEYQKVWEYIDTNPLKWEEDEYFAL